MTRMPWREPSDSELLDASRAGDGSAFAALWTRHRDAGLTAARHLAPPSSAEDVVSEAYLRIFQLVRTGKGPTGAFRPYLYRTIRSISADWWRRPEDVSDDLDTVAVPSEAGPWEDGVFDRSAAAIAFGTLQPRWQAVLWYTEVEGMAPRQAAKLLGLSANGVSALAKRARTALQSAWVEAHVDRELAAAACRETLSELQRYQRGKATAAVARSVEAHLAECRSCSLAAEEYSMLNRQLALTILGILLGTGTTFSFLGGIGGTTAASAAVGAAGLAGASNGSAVGAGGSVLGTGGASGAAGASAVGAAAASPAVVLAAAATAVALVVTGVTVSQLGSGNAAQPAAQAADSAGPSDSGADRRQAAPSETRSDARPADDGSTEPTHPTTQGASAPAHVETGSASLPEPRIEPRAPEVTDPPQPPEPEPPVPDTGLSTVTVHPEPPQPPTTDPPDESTEDPGTGDPGTEDPGPQTGTGTDPDPGTEGPGNPALTAGTVCWEEQWHGRASARLLGLASEPGTIRVRVSQAGASPVELPGAGGRAVGIPGTTAALWRTASLTPLAQWAGLGPGDLADALVEVRLVADDGRGSAWEPVSGAMPSCLL